MSIPILLTIIKYNIDNSGLFLTEFVSEVLGVLLSELGPVMTLHIQAQLPQVELLRIWVDHSHQVLVSDRVLTCAHD
jgi:hypothetical protein